MSHSYNYQPEKRTGRRQKWHRSPHPMPEAAIPLITEALASMSAWRAYQRQREDGMPSRAADAVYAAEYNRIMAHVGEPVDVLFGGNV